MRHISLTTRLIVTTRQLCSGSESLLRASITSLVVASFLTGCSAMNTLGINDPALSSFIDENRDRAYAGVALGNAQVSLGAGSEGLSTESSSGTGAQLRLGYDVNHSMAVEVDTSWLGSSKHSITGQSGEPATRVEYSTASVSALLYGLRGAQTRYGQMGFSVFGRLGFAQQKTSSNLAGLNGTESVPLVGVGAEYGFANGVALRSDITRFDNNATLFGLGFIYRFGAERRNAVVIAKAPEAAMSEDPVYVFNRLRHGEKIVEHYHGPLAQRDDQSDPNLQYVSNSSKRTDVRDVGTMNERWRPAMSANDKDRDGVSDHVDNCRDTLRHVTVDRYGCGLFDAELAGVEFENDSLWLEPLARTQLDQLAETLLAFPEAVVQIRAHVYTMNSAKLNLQKSSRRAKAVVTYLQSRGVHERQLKALGVGETQRLETMGVFEWQGRINRVEVVTLPEYDVDVDPQPNAVPRHPVHSKPVHRDPVHRDPVMLQAALPSSPAPEPQSIIAVLDAIGVGKIVPDANATMLALALNKRSKSNGVEVVAPRLMPLPQPGIAPDFALSGVLREVRFGPGSSQLTKKSENALKPLRDSLLNQPDVRVAIMAHTDNIGSTERNKKLSSRRADAVVSYLVSAGIQPERLKAEGYGELLPLVQNVTAADRQRNRRIEVRVLPEF